MLFRYGLQCSVCGKLESKFVKEEHAIRAGAAHMDSYWRTFGEQNHAISVLDLVNKTKEQITVAEPGWRTG